VIADDDDVDDADDQKTNMAHDSVELLLMEFVEVLFVFLLAFVQ
jgi:hypothetical protein